MSKQNFNKANEALNNNQLNKVAGGAKVPPPDLPPDLPTGAKTYTNEQGVTYYRIGGIWHGPDKNGAYG